ncbi:MAG TPA: hypothetical protein VFA47_02945 [Candidatus Manganitrophaceae bacterium]|nr:hypothetical protein [Candidatus Manganitrophaceae bacterium]
MSENLPEKRHFSYQFEWGGDPDRLGRPVGPLQRIKFTLFALLALATLFALLSTAFIIGLFLAVPLTLLSILWTARLAWRMRKHSRLHRF